MLHDRKELNEAETRERLNKSGRMVKHMSND
jgi:hypothetical protein